MRSGYSWSGHERNNCFFNLGDGTFSDVSYLSGLGFTDDGRGAAVVDWDGDGDLDVWLQSRAPRLRFMRNEYAGPNRSLAIRLVGTQSNRDAVGARAELRLTGGRRLLRTVRAGVNYSAQGSRWLHFGLGEEGAVEGLSVRWPSGRIEEFSALEVGGRHVVEEGSGSVRSEILPAPSPRIVPASFGPSESRGSGSIPLGVPFPLPEGLGLTDFGGQRHSFSSGVPTLVNFWASWCAGCMREFTDFAAHQEELQAAGMRILACSLDSPSDLAKALVIPSRFGLEFPMGLADPEVRSLLEALTNVVFDRFEDLPMPTSLLLDSDGAVARIYVGPVEISELLADVESLAGVSRGLESIGRASGYPGGHWLHPELWASTQRGTQLMRVSEMLSQEGHASLAADYSGLLAQFARVEERPGSWLDRAEGIVARAVSGIVLNDPAEAEQICREFLIAYPESVHVRVGLTAALLESGERLKLEEARDVFQAVRPDMRRPENERDHMILGITLYRLGEYEEALPHLEAATAVEVVSPELLVSYGLALIEAGRVDQGIAVIDRLPERGNPGLESRIAMALDRAGRLDEATTIHAKVVTMLGEPASDADRSLLAATHVRLGDVGTAISILTPQVAASPDRWADRLTLGRALTVFGDDHAARVHLEASISELPPDSRTQHLLGLVRARLGDLEGALECFESARTLEPGWVDPVWSAGLAYDRLERYDLSLERLREVLAASPGDAAVLGRLAEVCLRGGLHEEAVGYLRQLGTDPGLRFQLAWLLACSPSEEARNGEEALSIASELGGSQEDASAELLDLMAAALAELGRFEEAVAGAELARDRAIEGGRPDLASTIETRLELYRAGQPHRIPGL